MIIDNFDVEKYLLSSADFKILGEDDFFIIDRLCKKIDVVKKLYILYSSDLSVKRSDLEVSVGSYEVLLNILQSNEGLDYKFLNTALKLNDLLLGKSLISESKAASNNTEIISKLNLLDNEMDSVK